ncbi:hypothetical protein EYF80_044752 [Liparis tanakae]|uniref:Uncharacterized protein n=1 Tax=Liparis tanakae TaxID=230148 RepID=A0A4Z2FV12_9TELE|nr:hypothetical protein EYF80_044752 [Liparis tanakae]
MFPNTFHSLPHPLHLFSFLRPQQWLGKVNSALCRCRKVLKGGSTLRVQVFLALSFSMVFMPIKGREQTLVSERSLEHKRFPVFMWQDRKDAPLRHRDPRSPGPPLIPPGYHGSGLCPSSMRFLKDVDLHAPEEGSIVSQHRLQTCDQLKLPEEEEEGRRRRAKKKKKTKKKKKKSDTGLHARHCLGGTTFICEDEDEDTCQQRKT